MTTGLSPEQARSVAEFILEHPGRPIDIDVVGAQGERGENVVVSAVDDEVTFAVLIERSGNVETDPEGVLA